MFKNTPRPRKSEITRRLVMDKALATFLAKGYDQTTLRDLSQATGMSLGSFYYYFPSKESIILAFYDENFAGFKAAAFAAIAESDRFEKQLEGVLAARVATMTPQREIFLQLARVATDPRSPMSPFSPATENVRDATVAIFYELQQNTDLKVPRSLAPYLPHLLWFGMMGLILFWTFDESPEQARTKTLIPMLAKHLSRLLRALNLPLVGKHILPFREILALFPDLKPFAPKPVNIGDPQ